MLLRPVQVKECVTSGYRSTQNRSPGVTAILSQSVGRLLISGCNEDISRVTKSNGIPTSQHEMCQLNHHGQLLPAATFQLDRIPAVMSLYHTHLVFPSIGSRVDPPRSPLLQFSTFTFLLYTIACSCIIDIAPYLSHMSF